MAINPVYPDTPAELNVSGGVNDLASRISTILSDVFENSPMMRLSNYVSINDNIPATSFRQETASFRQEDVGQPIEVAFDWATEPDRTVQMTESASRLELTNQNNRPMRIVWGGELRGRRVRQARNEVAYNLHQYLLYRMRDIPLHDDMRQTFDEASQTVKIEARQPIPLHRHEVGERDSDCLICRNHVWYTVFQVTREILEAARLSGVDIRIWAWEEYNRRMEESRLERQAENPYLNREEYYREMYGSWQDQHFEAQRFRPITTTNIEAQDREHQRYLRDLGASWHGIEPTDVDRAECEAAQARIKAAHEQAKIADARAKELLMEHLSEEQKRSYAEHHYFCVQGQYTKQQYQIHTTHRAYNVYNHKLHQRYCVRPSSQDIPFHDQLLSQMLLLQANEQLFLQTANVRPF